MKSTILFFALLLALSGCSETSAQTVTSLKEDVSTVTLNVEGMTCRSCENAIKRTLTELSGVTMVLASHEKKSVTITFEAQKITLNTLKEAIINLGYEIK